MCERACAMGDWHVHTPDMPLGILLTFIMPQVAVARAADFARQHSISFFEASAFSAENVSLAFSKRYTRLYPIISLSHDIYAYARTHTCMPQVGGGVRNFVIGMLARTHKEQVTIIRQCNILLCIRANNII